ncbi:protein kinase [Sorangium sp. So ce1036]|uniref:serine/threonine-protein kinase n=1 Tax=Sorangium sp. So ce1036 TaxID=3133328 RepID=UPI003F0C9F58
MSDEEGVVPVRCGEIVAERYRVERLLGTGGMGTVVAARHLSLGELVAIKFMRAEYCGNPQLLRRFQREARGMFRLKTEHVPRVFDLGTLAPRPGVAQPVPFIVMEHLSGNDLRSIVERRGRLPVPEAAEYVRQACAAVSEAHALGMVHRDIKPANLFLTYRTDGTPLIKVLDFGVAKFTTARPEDEGLELTTARSVMGSRRYMAPEQMLTPRDVDLRADLWALGVVLYQLVSGALPFGAETLEQLVLVVTEQPPRPLRSACADLPDGFDEIVMRCLEKDRRLRPASAGELSAALAPFALNGPPDATLPTAVHRSEPTFTWREERLPTTADRPAVDKRPERRRAPRTWLTGTAGTLAAGAALLGVVLPSGWSRAPGATWADGAGAQRLAGVPQGLAAEPPTAAAAGPLEARRDALALDGAQHAVAGGAFQASAGNAPLVASDAACLLGSTRTAPPAAASAGQTQRAPAPPGRRMGMPDSGAPRRAPPQRQEGAARSGDAPSPSAAVRGSQRRPSPAAAASPAAPEAPASPAPLAPGAAHAAPGASAAPATPADPAASAAPADPPAPAAPADRAAAPGAAGAPGAGARTAPEVPDSPW